MERLGPRVVASRLPRLSLAMPSQVGSGFAMVSKFGITPLSLT